MALVIIIKLRYPCYYQTCTYHLGTLTHGGAVRMCCFSPDGGLLATASGDYKVRVWEVNSMTCLGVLDKHDCRYMCVAGCKPHP